MQSKVITSAHGPLYQVTFTAWELQNLRQIVTHTSLARAALHLGATKVVVAMVAREFIKCIQKEMGQ